LQFILAKTDVFDYGIFAWTKYKYVVELKGLSK